MAILVLMTILAFVYSSILHQLYLWYLESITW